ncbi:MAG: Ig domain-containing protein [Ruminococcus sp.]|nr:Ig domain-containing protein [Ruminococcus sp.]
MDVKKSNIIYTLFLCITIPVFLVFIFIPVFKATAAHNYNVDYNVPLELNEYTIKITDAAYLEDINEFDIMLSVKGKKNTKDSYPEIQRIIFRYNDNKKEIGADGYKSEKLSGISSLIKVSDVNSDIKYVEVYIYSAKPDYYDEDRTDEFGDIIPGEKHEGKTNAQRVIIDSSDIRSINSSDYRPVGKLAENDADNAPSGAENKTATTSRRTSESTFTTQNMREWEEENRKTSRVTTTKQPSDNSDNSIKISDEKSSDSSQKYDGSMAANGHYAGGNIGGGSETTAYTERADLTEHEYTEPPRTETTTTTTTTNRTTTTTRTLTTTTTSAAPTTVTEPPVIHVYEIYLDTGYDDNNVRLSIGDEYEISAVVLPENAADRSVSWRSNRPSVAQIDENGKIKAMSTGKAIIIATTNDGELEASCMVTVS